MQCTNPITLPIMRKGFRQSKDTTLPCGKCLACRIRIRSEWSLRCYHELEDWQGQSSFVTLTYQDNYLPSNGSLVKKDLQKFFKRLRSNMDHSIKYFACGEYGSETLRPHYHAILFGVSLKANDRLKVMQAWSYCDWNEPTIRDRSFGLVEDHSIQYVAGYIEKKLSGVALHYQQALGLEPTFRVCSQGLGKNFPLKYAEEIRKKGYISWRGKKHSIPRYYLKVLGLSGDDFKAFTDEIQLDYGEHLTGVRAKPEDVLKTLDSELIDKMWRTQERKNKQKALNIEARTALKSRGM